MQWVSLEDISSLTVMRHSRACRTQTWWTRYLNKTKARSIIWFFYFIPLFPIAAVLLTELYVELNILLFYDTRQMSVKGIFQNHKLLDLIWQEKRGGGGGWNLHNMHFFVPIHKQFWVVIYGNVLVSCKNLCPKKKLTV